MPTRKSKIIIAPVLYYFSSEEKYLLAHFIPSVQGCQPPDFIWDLRLFFLLQTFAEFFIYMPKTMTFHIPSQNKPASTLEFQYIYSILQRNFFEPRQKREEDLFSAITSCAWTGLWSAVTRMLSTSQSFNTFLIHNVGNPAGASDISNIKK